MSTPWRLKVATKLVLSRLPVRYATWRRLSLFRHGAMDEAAYALSVFDRHFAHAGASGRPGFVALELGPGDSAASALIAAAHGASATYLVDVGPFARRDLGPYRAVAGELRVRGLEPPDVDSMAGLDELLAACHATYMTAGLQSLRTIPDATVDFAWSHAVLEHVGRDEFDATMVELHRVLRPASRSSHRIDFEDHLAGSANHLRFSAARWETPAFRRSGFYTNRLTRADIVAACLRADFGIVLEDVERWDSLPVLRNELAEPFRSLPEDELLVRAMNLVLTQRLTKESR